MVATGSTSVGGRDKNRLRQEREDQTRQQRAQQRQQERARQQQQDALQDRVRQEREAQLLLQLFTSFSAQQRTP